MEKHDSWKKAEEAEIDVIDFLYSFCMQWKRVAVCAFVAACLMGGYGYLKQLRNQTAAVPEISVPEEKLTEEERWDVEEAIQLKEEIDGLKEYMEESILMQMDPYHRNQVFLLYSVDGAGRHELEKIAESYIRFLSGKELTDALGKADETLEAIDSVYLSELVLAWHFTDDNQDVVYGLENAGTEWLFYVGLTGKDMEMAQRLAKAVQKVMEGHGATVNEACGGHGLTLLSETCSVKADSGLQAQQHDKRMLLKTYRESLRAMTDALDKTQKLLYRKMIGVAEADVAGADVADEDVAWAGEGAGMCIGGYVTLGLCVGIFAYGCIFACMYFLRGAIHSENEFRATYAFPLYGRIPAKKQGKQRTGKRQEDGAQKMEQVLGRIKLACKNHKVASEGMEPLCLAVEFLPDGQDRAYVEHMSDQLQEWGIKTVAAEQMSSDISQWDALSKARAAILICKIGVTTHQMLGQAVEFYLENGLEIAGAVLLGGR